MAEMPHTIPAGSLRDTPKTPAQETGLLETPRPVSDSFGETLNANERPHSASGPKLGEFELQERLGKGGMGTVYKSFHPRLQKTVAIKILNDARDMSIDDLNRFRGEALLVATLQHANIVQVFDILQENGNPFIVMEYVDHGSLEKRLAGKPQPPRVAVEWMETIARAVAYAHEHKIIHRDLKPANILVTSDGVLKITDFGLGKRIDSSQNDTRSGVIIGTPNYMAPEQASGNTQQIGPPADIHALGAMLYEMLTGRPPFQGVNLVEILEQVINAEPAAPSRLVARIPKELSTICLKCLSKSPARRYESALALADDLHRWQEGVAILARPTGRVERLGRRIRRHPLRSASIVLATLLLASAATVFWLNRDLHFKEAQRAELERLAEQSEQDARQSSALYVASHDALETVLDRIHFDPNLRNAPGIGDLRKLLRDRYEGLVGLLEQDHRHDRLPLARAHDRIAKLYDRADKTDLALRNYEQSSRIYLELAKAENRPERVLELRLGLGLSLTEQGNLHFDLGHLSTTEDLYRNALRELEIARSLFANGTDGTTTQSARDSLLSAIAEVHHRLGSLLESQSKRQESLKEFKQALEIRQKLVENNPDNKEFLRDLARNFGYQGDVELDEGMFSQAENSYWKSHKIRGKLYKRDATAAADIEAAFQYARGFTNFGNYHIRLRNFSTARHYFTQAEEIQIQVQQKEPDNLDYILDLATSRLRLAEVGLLQKDDDPAIYTNLHLAHEELEKAVNKDTKQVPLNAGLAEACLLEAVLKADLKEVPPEVNSNLHHAADLLEQLNKVRPEANFKYLLASTQALRSESSGRPFRVDIGWFQNLKEALELGYQRKDVRDIENDRVFRKYKDQPEFRKLLKFEPAATPTQTSSVH